MLKKQPANTESKRGTLETLSQYTSVNTPPDTTPAPSPPFSLVPRRVGPRPLSFFLSLSSEEETNRNYEKQ